MSPIRPPLNPFDRWARSESGLHLPSRFVPGAARRLHHIEKNGTAQCCCGGDGDECDYCTFPTSTLADIYLTVDISVTRGTCTYSSTGEVFTLADSAVEGEWWRGGFQTILCSSSVKFVFAFVVTINCTSSNMYVLSEFTCKTWTWGGLSWVSEQQTASTTFQNDIAYSVSGTGDCLTRILTEEEDPLVLDWAYGSETQFTNASISYS